MIEYFLWFLVGGPISFVVLYIMFIIVFKLKPYEEQVKDKWYLYYPLLAFFIVGYIGDVLWNIIYGSIVWRAWPPVEWNGWKNIFEEDYTLTHRLKMIQRDETDCQPGDWDYKLAQFICSKLLNPFDAGHC